MKTNFRTTRTASGKIHVSLVVIVAAVLAVAAVLVYQQQEKSAGEKFQAKKLFDKLNIDQVHEVGIVTDTENFSVKKGDEAWGLTARGGYPVDQERLNKLVIALATLEASDRMTQDPEKYEALGVTDQPETAQIKLMDSEGGELATVYLGKEREGKPVQPGGFAPTEGQYLRINDDPWVYRINEQVSVTTSPSQWLQKEIVKVDEKNLQQVKVDSSVTTGSFTLARTGADPFRLLNEVPSGMRESTAQIGAVTRALNNLTLTDVHPANSEKVAGLDFNTTYTAVQKNGLMYVVGLAQKNDIYYAKADARYEKAFDYSTNDERTSDSVQAKTLELAETTMGNFNKKHQGWIYEIQGYQYNNLAKKLGDVIEPVPTPTPEPTPGPGAEAPVEGTLGEQPGPPLPGLGADGPAEPGEPEGGGLLPDAAESEPPPD